MEAPSSALAPFQDFDLESLYALHDSGVSVFSTNSEDSLFLNSDNPGAGEDAPFFDFNATCGNDLVDCINRLENAQSGFAEGEEMMDFRLSDSEEPASDSVTGNCAIHLAVSDVEAPDNASSGEPIGEPMATWDESCGAVRAPPEVASSNAIAMAPWGTGMVRLSLTALNVPPAPCAASVLNPQAYAAALLQPAPPPAFNLRKRKPVERRQSESCESEKEEEEQPRRPRKGGSKNVDANSVAVWAKKLDEMVLMWRSLGHGTLPWEISTSGGAVRRAQARCVFMELQLMRNEGVVVLQQHGNVNDESTFWGILKVLIPPQQAGVFVHRIETLLQVGNGGSGKLGKIARVMWPRLGFRLMGGDYHYPAEYWFDPLLVAQIKDNDVLNKRKRAALSGRPF